MSEYFEQLKFGIREETRNRIERKKLQRKEHNIKWLKTAWTILIFLSSGYLIYDLFGVLKELKGYPTLGSIPTKLVIRGVFDVFFLIYNQRLLTDKT